MNSSSIIVPPGSNGAENINITIDVPRANKRAANCWGRTVKVCTSENPHPCYKLFIILVGMTFGACMLTGTGLLTSSEKNIREAGLGLLIGGTVSLMILTIATLSIPLFCSMSLCCRKKNVESARE